MSEQKDFAEFMKEPENRAKIVNQFLAQAEAMSDVRRHVSLIEGLTFNDLTPQLWARVVSSSDSMKVLLDICEAALKASMILIDDNEAIGVISRLVEESQGDPNAP